MFIFPFISDRLHIQRILMQDSYASGGARSAYDHGSWLWLYFRKAHAHIFKSTVVCNAIFVTHLLSAIHIFTDKGFWFNHNCMDTLVVSTWDLYITLLSRIITYENVRTQERNRMETHQKCQSLLSTTIPSYGQRLEYQIYQENHYQQRTNLYY